MSVRHAAGALAALLLFAPGARAQSGVIDLLGAANAGRTVNTPSAGSPGLPAMSAPIDPAEYVLGPGDFLQVVLSGSITRSWDAMVLPEGALFVPSVGSIPVTGLSLVDARRVVLQRLSREYRGVTLELRLLRARSFLVYLAGETSRPGALEVSATSRVSEVLAEALFNGNTSRRNIELRRRTPEGETRLRIDLTRFRLTGYIAKDPLLREGDLLYLPRVVAEASIDGAVARAGRYDLAAGDSLSTLLMLAGGALPDAVEQAVLVRFLDATRTDSLSFRIADVIAGRFDVPLRNGDHAYVYYHPRFHFLEQAGIFGEIQRPGAYPLLPGLSRLSDLVHTAGGFLPSADLASLRVFRASGTAGEADPEIERLSQLSRRDMTASEYEVLRARVTARRQDFRVDWNRVRPGGDLDIVLRGGDIVRVDQVVASVRVEGEVRLPGLIHHEAGRSVLDYVRLAGGFSERASRGKVRVKRAVTGQTILARDVASLEPGDLVWVPERGEPATWQNLQTVLLVAAQLATVVLALRLR
jgi:protein involved in polysaccharide export with SLBB domain